MTAFSFPANRIGPIHALVAGLLTLVLAFAPATPARSGLDDCVATVVGATGAAADIAALGSKVSACLSASASDPAEAVVVATIVALVEAGQVPADTQKCDAVINAVIGRAVAQALLKAGVGNFDPQELQKIADGSGSVSNLPVLGALLSCGCTIAGAPEAAKEIAEKYMQYPGECVAFLKDAGEAVLNLLEDGICKGLSFVGGCRAAGGGDNKCYMDVGCFFDDCPAKFPDVAGATGGLACSTAGTQCSACGSWGFCQSIPHGIGIIPGTCTCEPPYSGRYLTTSTDYYGGNRKTDWLYECVCNSPNVDINGQCFCPSPLQLKDGVCVVCGSNEIYREAAHDCKACADIQLGTKPDADQTKCVAACDASTKQYLDGNVCKQCPAGTNVVYDLGLPGGLGHCEPACQPGQVFTQGIINPNTGAKTPDFCNTCPANTSADYNSPGNSIGKCVACPDGETSPPGSTSCQTLDCGKGGYVDPQDAHACKSCPAGQVYYPPVSYSVPTGVGKSVNKTVPGHCACAQDRRNINGVCTCPKGAIPGPLGASNPYLPCMCPAGAQVDDTFTCKCPTGSTLDPTGTKCLSYQPSGKQTPGKQPPAEVAPPPPPGRPGMRVAPPVFEAPPSGRPGVRVVPPAFEAPPPRPGVPPMRVAPERPLHPKEPIIRPIHPPGTIEPR